MPVVIVKGSGKEVVRYNPTFQEIEQVVTDRHVAHIAYETDLRSRPTPSPRSFEEMEEMI